MAIHHATQSKAAKNGIVLKEEGDAYSAFIPEHNRVIDGFSDPKIALSAGLLQKRLVIEYPAISFTGDGDTAHIQVKGYPDAEMPSVVFDEEYDEDAAFAEILEAYADATQGEPQGEDEGGAATGNIVSARYRQVYRERGNPNHCGDWLAKWLDGRFRREDGKFDDDGFFCLLEANGVELSGKWFNTSGRGAEGRKRMNGRQKLDRAIGVNGKMVDQFGREVEVPQPFLDQLARKHAHVEKPKRAKAA